MLTNLTTSVTTKEAANEAKPVAGSGAGSAAGADATGAVAEEHRETIYESLASICSVLVLMLFVTTFIFQNFEIPSGSMLPTLLIGDHVMVDRISLAPKTKWAPFVHYRDVRRGDVIVFFKPTDEDLFLVKRAVGLPGDRIHLKDGILYVNGVKQNEPQTSKPTMDDNPYHAFNAYRDDFPSISPTLEDMTTASWAVEMPKHVVDGDLVVPPGAVFAMGDNRLESLDGRYWGFVPRENIIGRPLFVYWSFETPADEMNKTSLADRMSFIVHIVTHAFDQTRWNRTLHVIR